MRRHSWLTSLYHQLANPTLRTGVRRQRRLPTAASATIERLEPRQLLTPGAAAVGFETRVNSFTPGDQGHPAGAMDAAGNIIAVWASNGEDGSGNGIYAQRSSAAGVGLGDEFKVNTFTTGEQKAPSAAMDATGDFVVTWESSGQDGSNYGVYAQRYNAAGVAQGGEFRVNTHTTNVQSLPSIAMDSAGDFVIAWQSYGQDGGGYGIYAQRYNSAGVAQGGEFKVNTYTTNDQLAASVAMDAVGDFVISWSSNGQDGSSNGVYAQRYNSAGTVQGTEFRVNTFTTGSQDFPSVAMDSVGAFVIAWSSFGQDGSSYGIDAQRYSSTGVAQGSEFQVNTFTTGDQRFPKAAMDSAGDFAITWDSVGQDGSAYGIFARRYSAAGIVQGSEFQVNTYTTGNQIVPSIAMDAVGDFAVAWASAGQDGGGYGVYAQRYVATVGPIITAVLEGSGPRVVNTGDKLTSSITAFSVNFSDDMNVVPGGANSVTNPSNWLLTRYGIDVSNQISGITFGFNASANRYVAVVSFTQPLTEGAYQLVARDAIHDLTGRMLDGEADGIPGGNFRRNFAVATTLAAGAEFRVNTHTTGDQIHPAVAMDAAGDYVAVWAPYGHGTGYVIYAQRYNAAGTPLGGQFQVNATPGTVALPTVAMDAAGDFAVAWQSFGPDGSSWGVYAQRFNAAGMAQGSEFKVNTYTTGPEEFASIAMDATGDFVITWQTVAEDGAFYGIFAQRYNAAGTARGSEFQVNTYTTGGQERPSVAMDAAGDFVIAWDSGGEDGSGYGVYAKRYNAVGVVQGGEFSVNTYTTNNQERPSVAMDTAGDFVIAWQSNTQDGGNYGTYAQRFNAAGAAQGSEFRVNTYTTGNQAFARTSMDAAGDFVVAWQSFGQDGSDYGVYAQRYNSAGTAQGGEFKVNTYTSGVQEFPAVAMDAVGNFVVAWQSAGQDGSGFGVYAQRYQADVAPLLYGMEIPPLSAAGPLNTPIASSLLVFDYDSDVWTGATIHISTGYQNGQDVLGFTNTNTPNITGSWNAGTGTLTLTGTDTVSDYRTALRNVTYHNSSGSPNTVATRTIDFQATDGLLLSNVSSRDLTVTTSSTPAVLSGVSGTGTYDEASAPITLAANLVITDPSTVYLTSATVSFTNWQGEDRVDFNNIFALQHSLTQDFVGHTASLTITGTDTLDHYQTLLRSVIYWDVSNNPVTTTRVANFTVSDGLSTSNMVSRNIVVVSIDNPPVLSAIETTPLAYKANDPAFPPQPISATLLVGDPDSNNCTKATVQITGGYQNDGNGHDVLSFTNQLGITGSFNAMTGTMTLTGTSGVGNYRTALRSVTFSSSGTAVSTADRTLTITATDDFSPTPATSLPITRTVTVLTTNQPPALTGIPATALAYARGTAPTLVAPGILIYDPDSINMTQAMIQVTSNHQNSQDVLAFTSGFGVTGLFNSSTGTLTLTGTTSLANYQTLLRSVTYKTNTSGASTLTRAISFTINDGLALSDPVSRNVNLT